MESTKSTFAFAVFERAFKDYGLPEVIRTDNGAPFETAKSLLEGKADYLLIYD